MKKLMMLCIIALAVAIALPAFAEVQNVKVSGDLSARAIVRRGYNLDKDATATSKTTTNYIQGAAEVQVEADMTDNVSTVVRFADQRNWGDNTGLAAGNSTNQFNLLVDLANVTLKEFVYSPLTLTIGRQDLWFGKGFIVGAKLRDPSAAISAPEYTVFNSFDAIKATLDFDPWKLDAVYSIIEENAINLNDNV
ncbi:MAG: alginate export family protein, partial [Candidatus Omnitrophota bacterium]